MIMDHVKDPNDPSIPDGHVHEVYRMTNIPVAPLTSSDGEIAEMKAEIVRYQKQKRSGGPGYLWVQIK